MKRSLLGSSPSLSSCLFSKLLALAALTVAGCDADQE